MKPVIILLLCVACWAECGKATVNIVVSINDGLVVAADSRVTLQDNNKTRIASDYGQKIIRVGSHVGVAFSGAAYMLDSSGSTRSMSSLIESYKAARGISDGVRTEPRAVAHDLDSLFAKLYRAHPVENISQGPLEVVILGYDSKLQHRVFVYSYPIGGCDSSFSYATTGALVRGQVDVWNRLIKGCDPQVLTKAIRALASTRTDTITLANAIGTVLDSVRYDIRYDLMGLQDAIDFAVYIVRATIETQRFNQGSIQGVGGAIDIAIITPDGFQWIQHKRLRGESLTSEQ